LQVLGETAIVRPLLSAFWITLKEKRHDEMRKSFWIVLALLVVGAAQVAHADSFTYSYDLNVPGLLSLSWTTDPITGVTGPTTVLAADLAASANTGFIAGCTTTSVVLDASGVGIQSTIFGGGCGLSAVIASDNFALSDYTTPGVYHGTQGTLTVTEAVTAAEPSSVALMLLGVGILFVMRKRIRHDSPAAV
jgi:hypothetical protein